VDLGRSGWFDFELRIGNGGGGAGRVGSIGFGFDPTGAATSTRPRDYILPRNSGSTTADLFRTGVVSNYSSVDTSVLGTFLIYYIATDEAGNRSVTTRTVTITDQPDTTAPVITINGGTPYTTEAALPYIDLGATVLDDRDGNITGNLSIDNKVNPYILGTYNVTYTISDVAGNQAEAIRVVNVTDTTKPVITINGEEAIFLNRNATYTEQGATANDTYYGDLTDDILIGGDIVDTANFGAYRVTYYVTDASGNSAIPVTRTVLVRSTDFAPTAYWAMDDKTGDQVKDTGEFSHNGTLNSANPDANRVAGKEDGALQLDGSSEYVTLDNSPELSPSTFTFSYWLQPNSSLVGKEHTIYWAKPDGRWTSDGFLIRVDDRLGVKKGSQSCCRWYNSVRSCRRY
jgi:hypothetical protein